MTAIPSLLLWIITAAGLASLALCFTVSVYRLVKEW